MLTKATLFTRMPFSAIGYQVTEKNMEEVAKWCLGHVVHDGDILFIRVPVIRPAHSEQTKGVVGSWILESTYKGERTFKVYSESWLRRQFVEIPMLDDGSEDAEETSSAVTDEGHCCCHHKHTHDNVRALPTTPSIPAPTAVNFRSRAQ